MGQEIEIEFKNLLTKEEYLHLLKHFQISSEMIKRQTNVYFDTPSEHLKNLAAGLRIRQKENKTVCTLKVKSSENVHIETTEEIKDEHVQKMIDGKDFCAPLVRQRLNEYHVPIDQLQIVARITTDRVEVPYKDGTLVFDHSYYLKCEDYEVEYETNNEQLGEQIFHDFLKTHNIEKKFADKKIARYMKALKTKEGN